MTIGDGTHALDEGSSQFRVAAACGYWIGPGTLLIDPTGLRFRAGSVMRAVTGVQEVVHAGSEVEYVRVRLGRGGAILALDGRDRGPVILIGLRRGQRTRILAALRESRIDVIESWRWFVPSSWASRGPKIITPAFIALCVALVIALGVLASALVAALVVAILIVGFLGLVFSERIRFAARRGARR